MSKRKEILSETLMFASTLQFTQLLAVVGGILTRNFLGPVQMGIWAVLQLVLQYSSYTVLGTTEAIAREIPYYVGKKQPETAQRLKDLVVSFQMTISLAAGSLVFVSAFVLKERLEGVFFWGLIATAALLILQRFDSLLIALLRAHRRFEIASRQMLLSAVVNLALIAVFASAFKIYGFLIAMILSFIFNITYNLFYSQLRFRFILNGEIWGLISFGFPLMMLYVLEALCKSIDKIMIAKMLGLEALGLYTVPIMASNFMGQFSNAIFIIFRPHFQEKFGERDSIQDVKLYVDKAVSALANFVPLITGVSWVLIPFFIQTMIPKFVTSTRAAQFLILSSFPIALSLPYGLLMVTLKKHLRLFPISAFTLGLGALLDWAAIKAGFGIEGVALTTTISLFVSFLILFWTSSTFLYSLREAVLKLLSVFGRFIFMAGTLFLIEFFLKSNDSLFHMSLQLFVFLVISSPLLYSLNKELDLISYLKEKLSWLNRLKS